MAIRHGLAKAGARRPVWPGPSGRESRRPCLRRDHGNALPRPRRSVRNRIIVGDCYLPQVQFACTADIAQLGRRKLSFAGGNMFFVLHAFDKAGALETRLKHYDAHKAFLADTSAHRVSMIMSGPARRRRRQDRDRQPHDPRCAGPCDGGGIPQGRSVSCRGNMGEGKHHRFREAPGVNGCRGRELASALIPA
jgi:hypothetical protein